MDVVCPDAVAAGDTITVETEDHGSFTIAVPAGVLPGDTFQVELPGTAYDGYGGLGSVARELEEAHRIASEFSGASLDMRDLKPGAAEVLAAALRQLVNAVEDVVDELDDFISGSCGKFASWRGMDGEQELEWTSLHQEYVVVVEGAIASTLKELECKAEDVFSYAQVHGGDQVDKAMTRLLALAEYRHFCEMMHRYAEEEELAGSMGVMGM